jgi:hypothetical protein
MLLAALLAVAVLAGCGGGEDGQGSDDVPSGAVAKVGDAEIEQQDLDDQVAMLARSQRGSGGKQSGKQPAKEQLEQQALSVLVTRRAFEQEAADRGIEVTDEEVAQRWQAVGAGQFKTKRALRRFLGGQTQQELLDQLRLQLLSERINAQISEEAGGGKQGAKAVKRFQEEFGKRWADRTACAEGYTAGACSDDSDAK